MSADLVKYVADAISRAEAGDVTSPSGSWLAGIFGKAANLFEKEFRSYVDEWLGICGLTYPNDFRKMGKSAPPYEKLTLGQLIAVTREAGERNSKIIAKHIACDWTFSRFLYEVGRVNETWVKIKHGDEVTDQMLLAHMKTVLVLAKLLRINKSQGGV